MDEFLTPIIVGIFLLIFGGMNYKGNVSSLHRYHRNRVRAEDILPFGKTVGTGTLLVGAALILYGIASLLSERFASELLLIVGTTILILGIVAGILIILYGIIKYNKGLF